MTLAVQLKTILFPSLIGWSLFFSTFPYIVHTFRCMYYASIFCYTCILLLHMLLNDVFNVLKFNVRILCTFCGIMFT